MMWEEAVTMNVRLKGDEWRGLKVRVERVGMEFFGLHQST